MQNYFDDRKVLLRENDLEVSKDVNRGCPQGSVLSPGLWNLVFDSNLTAIQAIREYCDAIAFADDEVLIIQGRSHSDLNEKAKTAMSVIDGWCENYKLELSLNKGKYMIIGGKLKFPLTVEVKEKSL